MYFCTWQGNNVLHVLNIKQVYETTNVFTDTSGFTLLTLIGRM
jgi:hypothetical protein